MIVLFVCLAVQLSAATAPFVHQHAAVAGHHDDHASFVHRHLAPHGGDARHHDDDHDDGDPDGRRISVVSAASATLSGSPGGMSPRHQARAGLHAPVTPVVAIQAPAAGTAAPDHDVGRRVPHAPDLASSALRGPPR